MLKLMRADFLNGEEDSVEIEFVKNSVLLK